MVLNHDAGLRVYASWVSVRHRIGKKQFAGCCQYLARHTAPVFTEE